MPSGYTAPVQDGEITEFTDFAWSCARAMGALIMMRDLPSSAPIPERFEPSTDYHDRQIEDAKARLTELANMTLDELQQATHADCVEAKKSHDGYEAKKAEQRQRYEAMLNKVQAWQPPTSEHVGFKDFMVQQLTSSIEWDCTPRETEVKELSPSKWLKGEIESAQWNLDYHTKARCEEIERTEARNRWLAELRASLAA
ncbi:hypothetical protein [Methylorubrum extorquens]|uniref:hypothetical protein n=1 Tax=Methylorubrum extorquens TaxID=408 RepID=UPI0020A20A4B|nr:hypothetical protein [Methylorubrum extorquens]MCP1540109.1 hypothetical protein [Methylorubrum extorquens]